MYAIDFHWICLLLMWPWQRSNWSGGFILGSSSMDVSTLMMKIFQTKADSFCHFPSFKFETFCDLGDLENKIKVKLLTCKKRYYNCASWVEVSSLYLKSGRSRITEWSWANRFSLIFEYFFWNSKFVVIKKIIKRLIKRSFPMQKYFIIAFFSLVNTTTPHESMKH